MVHPKIALVILNYNDYDSTIACCEGHLGLNPTPGIVIIVDNGSTNDSHRILLEKYRESPSIRVVNSEENLGFSGGFNVGINLARKLEYNDVICANSDTVPRSRDLMEAFRFCLETESNVGLIAPQIIETTGDRNPEYKELNIRYLLQLVSAMYPRIANYTRKVPFLQKLQPGTSEPKTRDESAASRRGAVTPAAQSVPTFHDVFKVHGSYFLLARDFLDAYGGLDDDIFLQGEEHLISWMIFKAKLRTFLVSDRDVFHAGGSSKRSITEYKSRANDVNFIWKLRTAKILRQKISVFTYFSYLLLKPLHRGTPPPPHQIDPQP